MTETFVYTLSENDLSAEIQTDDNSVSEGSVSVDYTQSLDNLLRYDALSSAQNFAVITSIWILIGIILFKSFWSR